MTTDQLSSPVPAAARPASAVATRSVVVIDRDLPKGLAANAASVLALTLGARRPQLVGRDATDAGGTVHPGLVATGLPVLGADAQTLAAVRAAALERDLLVIDFPTIGQQTTDYDAYCAAVEASDAVELAYLGIVVSGAGKAVRRVTGGLGLLR